MIYKMNYFAGLKSGLIYLETFETTHKYYHNQTGQLQFDGFVKMNGNL